MNTSLDMIEQAYALITNESKQVLLVQESDGSWSLPGGVKEEVDNDLEATLNRELKEELDLDPSDYLAEATDVSVSFVYDERSKSRRGQEARIDLFLVQLNDGIQVKPQNEILVTEWFGIEDAKQRLAFDEHKDLISRGVKIYLEQ